LYKNRTKKYIKLLLLGFTAVAACVAIGMMASGFAESSQEEQLTDVHQQYAKLLEDHREYHASQINVMDDLKAKGEKVM
jgi:ATP-dependent exoDNAse (exonuclease V) alpha subunit